jgi:manganese/zinc/iron transport system permease protein
MIDAAVSLLTDPTVRVVATGTAAVGAAAGAVGTFAVVRRQSLQGDAISHAALPGVMLAFLLGGRSPAALAVGAAATGWVAMALVGGVVRRTRVPFDAALAGALSVFFGLGLALMQYTIKNISGASSHGLERYLLGQAAVLLREDLVTIAAFGGVAVAILLFGWKELKLVSFDPDFAATLGLPTRRLDLLLTTLVVAATVVGLQAVGVVLMSALLIAPAAAARQWTDRLGPMTALSALFGAAAGVGGTLVGHALSDDSSRFPAGPVIVLTATAFVVVSLLLAPRRGLVWTLRPSNPGV